MCPSKNVEETKKKEEEGPLQRVINSFLAAMSSSRSDDVTKSVRPFVVIFFLVVFLVFSPEGVQRCFKKVLRMFEVSIKF